MHMWTSGPRISTGKFFGPDLTKMFHVKHFGPIEPENRTKIRIPHSLLARTAREKVIAFPFLQQNGACGCFGVEQCGGEGRRKPSMNTVRRMALSAALAIFAQSAALDHAHAHRKPRHARVHSSLQFGSGHANQSSYYVPDVRDLAGKPVPVMQIPGSVTVVPGQVLDDQQAISLCEALRNVSGVFCR